MDDRFDELISKTQTVSPRADFAGRVMATIERPGSDPNSGFWRDLPRVARLVVPVAMLAAAAGAVWAFRTLHDVDDAALGGDTTDQIVLGTFAPAEESEP